MSLTVAVPVEPVWHRVPGGTARATLETASALAARDDVAIAPFAAWHRSSDRERAGLPGVRFAPLPRPALYEAWLRFDRPSVERFVGPVDVTWAASMLPVATEAPLVATVHDLDFLANPERSSRRGRSLFPRAFAAVADRAQSIVCPSDVVAEDCARHGIDAERLRVVPWGVGPPLVDEASAACIGRRLGLPNRFALWVGTLEPRKNLPALAEAMARVDGDLDLGLVVAGPTGWNVDGADVLAPFSGRIYRLGCVSDAELSALYRLATVFVFPSLVEGFGLPVLEAMAHGTPVVTSSGTATEQAAGGAALLADPADADQLAAAIESVVADPATQLDLATRGRQRACERSWAATAEGYAAVFHQVAGRS